MIRLECTQGNSNKYYEIDIETEGNRIVTKAYYGRIGNAPQVSYLYSGDCGEDAQAAMNSQRIAKIKKGYRLVSDDAPVKTPATIKSITPLSKKSVVNTTVPAELPVFWSMNALGCKDESHANLLMFDPKYVAQEKLDGMRAIIHITKDGLRIFSRNAGVENPEKPLEKTQSLPSIAKLTFPELIGTVLDAEILGDGKTSAELAGDIHRKESVESSTSTLNVFDILALCGKDLRNETLSVRLGELDRITPQLESNLIRVPPYAYTTKEKKALKESIEAKNGEGLMFKNLDAVYVSGGRPSKNWYKMKKSASFDCVVIGFTEGNGKYANGIGAVIFGQFVGGVLTEIGQTSGMSDSIRKDMSDNRTDWIGKAIVIEGMERLKSGAIRHPRYKGRSDKSASDCIYYENEQ